MEDLQLNLKHFGPDEFKCKCGCGLDVELRLKFRADYARGLALLPFKVVSGARCEAHNAYIGGSPTSSHLKRLAVDIACDTSRDRYIITKALTQAGFSRIGIADTFIHFDLDEEKPQEVIWTYGG